MVNQKTVEYNSRTQRIEKSLKCFVIEERRKRTENEDDPLEGIIDESWYISKHSQPDELLSQYCLPTPKSLTSQMVAQNYDDHHPIDLNSMMSIKYDDMTSLIDQLDSIKSTFEKLSFEKDIGGCDESTDCNENSSLFDGVNFEINRQLKTYKSNFENKRLSKFLSRDKDQKTIFECLKPSQKRKVDEPKLSEENDRASNLKKQKLISEYTCHQSGEEMFEILDRSIERKKQYQQQRRQGIPSPTPQSSIIAKTTPVNQTLTNLLNKLNKAPTTDPTFPSDQSIMLPVTPIPPQSIILPTESSTTQPAALVQKKPQTYMERIKDQAKQFHAKHTKSTVTIKKKDKHKTRDILTEEDDFSILQVDSTVVNNLFSYTN